jgi:hypothetical protein
MKGVRWLLSAQKLLLEGETGKDWKYSLLSGVMTIWDSLQWFLVCVAVKE